MSRLEAAALASLARQRVASIKRKERDVKVKAACKRAVEVGGRFRANPLPEEIRFKNYKDGTVPFR